VKDKFRGLTVIVGVEAAVTVSVTGTVLGLFEAPEEVIVTVPV
jgi:hypothetical protein